jgi:hypothetical protein
MLAPQNQSLKYEHLFSEIDTGRIKLPKFQRDFVWPKDMSARLIDSIIKGYPIGTFILWRTREELSQVKEIGNAKLPPVPKGDSVSYVLDGQQRITSLYAIRKGVVFQREGKSIDFKEIFVDLDKPIDSDESLATAERPAGKHISVHQLLQGELMDLVDKYPKEALSRIERFQKRLTGYDFSVIVLPDYPIDTACEVFTRINTTGQELDLFDIMVAKTYDADRRFDLRDRVEQLMRSKEEKSLEDVGYGTLRPQVILQTVAAVLVKQVRRVDILRLSRERFVEVWDDAVDALFSAVDYLRSELRIPVSELLPYESLIVPIAYFFSKTNGRAPTAWQSKLLTQFLFWAALGERYSAASEGKIGQDLLRIDSILAHKRPSYDGEDPVKIDTEELQWEWFSAGSAFCKAVLCVYAYHQPKSFQSNAIVTLDNSNLKRANSRNFHHFFPKAFLRKHDPELDTWRANSIVNITLVDEDLNKRIISAKAPSEYITTFARRNKHIETALDSHLIGDLEEFGIEDDNYERFIRARAKRIRTELIERLEPDLPAADPDAS